MKSKELICTIKISTTANCTWALLLILIAQTSKSTQIYTIYVYVLVCRRSFEWFYRVRAGLKVHITFDYARNIAGSHWCHHSDRESKFTDKILSNWGEFIRGDQKINNSHGQLASAESRLQQGRQAGRRSTVWGRERWRASTSQWRHVSSASVEPLACERCDAARSWRVRHIEVEHIIKLGACHQHCYDR